MSLRFSVTNSLVEALRNAQAREPTLIERLNKARRLAAEPSVADYGRSLKQAVVVDPHIVMFAFDPESEQSALEVELQA